MKCSIHLCNKSKKRKPLVKRQHKLKNEMIKEKKEKV